MDMANLCIAQMKRENTSGLRWADFTFQSGCKIHKAPHKQL